MAAAGRNLRVGGVLFLLSFVVFAAAMYGVAKLIEEDEGPAAAADSLGGGSTGGGGGPVRVTLVAKDLKFDPRTIAAAPGAEVTVVLDNRDAGVLHNFSAYNNSSAGQKIFVGELFTGPATREYKFTAPSGAGNYFFRCDVHPDTMTGTFSVK